jgi:hypothetical protein
MANTHCWGLDYIIGCCRFGKYILLLLPLLVDVYSHKYKTSVIQSNSDTGCIGQYKGTYQNDDLFEFYIKRALPTLYLQILLDEFFSGRQQTSWFKTTNWLTWMKFNARFSRYCFVICFTWLRRWIFSTLAANISKHSIYTKCTMNIKLGSGRERKVITSRITWEKIIA